MKKPHDVKDLKLAEKGRGRIEWASRSMPVLASIAERFRKQKPLKGIRVSACLHVTSETAFLMTTLQAAGPGTPPRPAPPPPPPGHGAAPPAGPGAGAGPLAGGAPQHPRAHPHP